MQLLPTLDKIQQWPSQQPANSDVRACAQAQRAAGDGHPQAKARGQGWGAKGRMYLPTSFYFLHRRVLRC